MTHHQRIPLTAINQPDPTNGRLTPDPTAITELAHSIVAVGLLNPITLRPTGDTYELLAGARRLAAYRQLGRATIPATIINADDRGASAARLVENVARSNISPIEEAAQLAEMVQNDPNAVDGVAAATARPVSWILDRLELLSWPESLQAHVHTKHISLAAAKRLARIPDPETRERLIKQAADHGISARTAALWLQDATNTEPTTDQPNQLPTHPLAGTMQTTTTIPCFACKNHHDITQIKSLPFCPNCLQELARLTQPQTPIPWNPPPTTPPTAPQSPHQNFPP